MTQSIDPVSFAARLRRYLGGPPVQEITDEDMVSLVKENIRRVSRDIGTSSRDTQLDYIQCVVGQQSYDLPADRRIIECFWGPQINEVDVVTGAPNNPFPEIPSAPNRSVIMGAYWRSDALIDQLKSAQIRAQWQYEIIDGKVYLDPIPTVSDAKLYYLYVPIDGGGQNLTQEHARALLFASAADAMRHLANVRRGGVAAGLSTLSGGRGVGTSDALDLAATRNDDLYSQEMMRLKSGAG